MKFKTSVTIEYLFSGNELKEVWIFSPVNGILYATLVTSVKSLDIIHKEIVEVKKQNHIKKSNIYESFVYQ